jgi:hypothetical protein
VVVIVGVEVPEARRTDPVRESDTALLVQIRVHLVPGSLRIADLLAVRADRDQAANHPERLRGAPQGLDLLLKFAFPAFGPTDIAHYDEHSGGDAIRTGEARN